MNRFFISMIIAVSALYTNSLQALPAASRAKWIWSQENPMDNHRKLQVRYFIKEFILDEVPVNAVFTVAADDDFEIYVNGKCANIPNLHNSGAYRNAPVELDLKSFLQSGKNRIVFKVVNRTLQAGLIFRGSVTVGSGRIVEIYSDAGTAVTDFLPKNDYTGAEYKPIPTREVGDATRLPWSPRHADYRKLMYPDEIKKADERLLRQKIQCDILDKKLLAEPLPQVKTVYHNGMPFFDINGKLEPVFIYSGWHNNPDDLARGEKLRRLRDCGIRIISQNTFPARCLNGDKFDFSPIRQLLLETLLEVPDAYLFIGINLEPAMQWIKEHPETWIRYADCDPVVGAHPLENPAMPSPVSPVYRKYMLKVLEEFFAWLKTQGVSRRIIGVRLDYGVYGEWHYFGMVRNMPDTGKDMENYFRKYLQQIYPDDAALQKAWQNSHVTRESATVPDKKERETRSMLSLRDPVRERKMIDFLYCMQQAVTETQMIFNSAVKNYFKRSVLTGNYSGYFFGMIFAAEGWQGNSAQVLDSDAVDFHVGPYCYDPFRHMGEAGISRNVTGSYPLRNKLYILESDTRTHLTTETNRNYSANAAESSAQLMRDFCNALFHGSGIHFFDFGYSNWYDDPEILRSFKEMYNIYTAKKDCSSVSEVVVVCDFESIIYHTCSGKRSQALYGLLSGSVSELSHCGVPFDMVNFSDLAHPGIKDYKAYIFLNAIYLSPEKRKIIDELKKKNKSLAFIYAPGALTEKGMDINSISAVTGMNMRYLHTAADLRMKTSAKSRHLPDLAEFRVVDGPLFYIADPEVEITGYCDVRGRLLASAGFKKDNGSLVLFSAGPLHESMLRKFFRDSSVHIYNHSRDVTFVNSGFIAIHTGTGGKKNVILPEKPAKVNMLYPRNIELNVQSDRISFELPANRTAVLEVVK
ncbi:MAG: hypothetical protein E7057_05535 [Lentisphaerae bacterium]|nr:hypothetical protein [Lentisphaerota bacterium]